jgi:hypothetical protein
MHTQPEPAHLWLHKLVGDWTYDGEAVMDPNKPPQPISGGTESVRSIGGLWVVAEGRGTMPDGGPATMLLTIGYDPQRKRFVGTWVGSMMTYLWVYDGSLSGNTLTLETDGPNVMGDGKMTSFREVVELKDRDTRTFRSTMRGENGEWVTIMSATYRRSK